MYRASWEWKTAWTLGTSGATAVKRVSDGRVLEWGGGSSGGSDDISGLGAGAAEPGGWGFVHLRQQRALDERTPLAEMGRPA